MEGEYENVWGTAHGLDQRGRHPTTSSAIDAALKELLVEQDPFFYSLCDNWRRLFPKLPAHPGRHEDGKIFIYVKNAPLSFTIRPKLRAIAAELSKLPNAPKKLNLKVEIHSTND